MCISCTATPEEGVNDNGVIEELDDEVAIDDEDEEAVEASFEVTSLEVFPTEVVEGTPALIKATISNVGTADGYYTVVLEANDIVKEEIDIFISAESSETVTFELIEKIAGIYTLSIGEQTIKLKTTGSGLLNQNLAQLESSDGKIVDLEPFKIDSPFQENVEIFRMRYLSDDLQVVGFIVKPKTNDIQYPVIIFNRGGNREFGKIDTPGLTYLSYLADQGYVIIASQYRGNDGGQGKEEFGGSDVNDVLNLIPLARSLDFTMPDKIGMLGFSRGGMMTYIAISKTDDINAAAVVGGVTDCIQGYNEREDMRYVYRELIGGSPTQKEAEFKKRSAYFWPEKINTPVLILHGEDDWRVNVTQAQKLGDKLNELGKTYELITYPGGDHGLNKTDRDTRILNWFMNYLR